jgi:branched-chain amino acid transport system ATP-binding protein
MLTLARTLMTNPDILLLDEPLEGLAPIVVEELTAAIERMNEDEKMAVVLVEQHAAVALSLTEQALVIERGAVAWSGAAADLMKDQARLDRYIGLNLSGSAAVS